MSRLNLAVAQCCQQYRLEQKWLLAPNRHVGHQWLETVARAGCPVVNVHIKTLKSLAIELAAPENGTTRRFGSGTATMRSDGSRSATRPFGSGTITSDKPGTSASRTPKR